MIRIALTAPRWSRSSLAAVHVSRPPLYYARGPLAYGMGAAAAARRDAFNTAMGSH